MSTQKVKLVIGAVSLLGGLSFGWLAKGMLSEPEIIEKEITRIEKEELSDEDLLALCETLTEEQKKDVLGVAQEVQILQEVLAEKEAELGRLKQEAESNEEKRAAAAQRWKAMESEIEALKTQLEEAIQERDELKEELQETLVALNEQITETNRFKTKAKRYKKESIKNLWSSFTNEAKLAGCNRGSQRRHSKCYEAFDLGLNAAFQERFKTCVNTHQATPEIRKAERGETLPSFSEWLPQDNKYTKNWYIIFCDPTLPEANPNEFE
ncbi:MAG: hypothetical protein ACON4U_05805 [Myxococcota bacterium]